MATCDQFGFMAVNRRVASPNLARGAKFPFVSNTCGRPDFLPSPRPAKLYKKRNFRSIKRITFGPCRCQQPMKISNRRHRDCEGKNDCATRCVQSAGGIMDPLRSVSVAVSIDGRKNCSTRLLIRSGSHWVLLGGCGDGKLENLGR